MSIVLPLVNHLTVEPEMRLEVVFYGLSMVQPQNILLVLRG